MIRMEQATLAQEAGVSVDVIEKIEATDGPVLQEPALSRIIDALRRAGVRLSYKGAAQAVVIGAPNLKPTLRVQIRRIRLDLARITERLEKLDI